MEAAEITLCNACADLMSLKEAEAFPLFLLRDKRAGEWIGVRDLCEQVGATPTNLPKSVFAAWLPDPVANDAYAVVMFYDDESQWSMAAHFNRERLLSDAMRDVKPLNGKVVPPTLSALGQPMASTAGDDRRGTPS